MVQDKSHLAAILPWTINFLAFNFALEQAWPQISTILNAKHKQHIVLDLAEPALEKGSIGLWQQAKNWRIKLQKLWKFKQYICMLNS
jgi:hypothetical protein